MVLGGGSPFWEPPLFCVFWGVSFIYPLYLLLNFYFIPSTRSVAFLLAALGGAF